MGFRLGLRLGLGRVIIGVVDVANVLRGQRERALVADPRRPVDFVQAVIFAPDDFEPVVGPGGVHLAAGDSGGGRVVVGETGEDDGPVVCRALVGEV